MITTATRRPVRTCDLVRLCNRLLGKANRSAAWGWDVRTDSYSGAAYITLNYFDHARDREALAKIEEATQGRYDLDYTQTLKDYDHLPEDYNHCGVIDVRRITAPVAEETPAPVIPVEPVTVTLPDAFADWFADYGPYFNISDQDADDALFAARKAYRATTAGQRVKITTASDVVLRGLLDATAAHVKETRQSIADDPHGAAPLERSARSTEMLAERIAQARRDLAANRAQAAQEAPTAPTAPQEAPAPAQGPQEGPQAPVSVWATAADGKRIEYAYVPNGDPARVAHFADMARTSGAFTDISTDETPAPVVVDVEYTGELRRQLRGTVTFHATPSLPGRSPQLKIIRSAYHRADGRVYSIRNDHRDVVGRGTLTEALTAAAASIGITAPLDVRADDRMRPRQTV